jgi:hypothetical protein
MPSTIINIKGSRHWQSVKFAHTTPMSRSKMWEQVFGVIFAILTSGKICELLKVFAVVEVYRPTGPEGLIRTVHKKCLLGPG